VNAVAQTLALFRFSHLSHSLSTPCDNDIISLKDLPQHSHVSTASVQGESIQTY